MPRLPLRPVHPRRAAIHENRTIGDRAADRITALVGSWKFIIWQNVIVFAWIVFNLIAIFGLKWDPYPFILLNLVFSWQASNTGPILQLTGNRQAAKDRHRDDIEAEEVELLTQEIAVLKEINRLQLEILQRMDK